MALVETIYPYNAFLDESIQNRHGATIVGVAAYVASFDRWLALEVEWRGILKRFEVPLDGKEGHTEPFFHMTDFIARRAQFDNDWWNEKRDAFMERLTTAASEHTVAGVGVCVNAEEYDRVLPKEIQGFWREPYFFCVWGVMQTLSTLEERFSIVLPTPIWCLFDRRQKARRFAPEIFYTVKDQSKSPTTFGQMGFGEMWNTPQLQATDLLVYEATRRKVDCDHEPSIAMRQSLTTLARKKKLLLVDVTEDGLRAYVEFARKAQESSR